VKVLLGLDADIIVRLIVQVDAQQLALEHVLMDVGMIANIAAFVHLAAEEHVLARIVLITALAVVNKLAPMIVKMLVPLDAKPAAKVLVGEAAQEDAAAVQISALVVVVLVRADVLKNVLESAKDNVLMLKCSQLVI
jgi:hypothetical protein